MKTMFEKLLTFDGGSEFKYEWGFDDNIKLYYGKEFKQKFSFDGLLYDELIREFKGKTVRLNQVLNEINVEDWLIGKGIKTRITSYLGSILCYEKHAKKGTDRGIIIFK